MKRFYSLSTLVLTLFVCNSAIGQDFSNKGKDFWVAYGYHQVMTAGNSQDMVLYFATEAVTNVTVSIPGIGYNVTYSNIPANTVFTSGTIPKSSPDARLTFESFAPENKGIHITSDKPIVAYAHIYNQSVSGATILYPTNTLGREYYSVNYTNNSNSNNSNCWFYVIAADTGTTTVEITPSANTIYHTAGVPFQVNLTQGQVYNIMGTVTGNFGVDLTGSTIKSVSANGACKKIAVFSGSGRIYITCNGSTSSSDNYMVQSLPKTAWGKEFLTVSSANYANSGNPYPLTNNFFRICVSDPTANVLLNGVPIGLPLQNNFYYQVGPTDQPMRIQSDKPITVAQYFPSSQSNPGCGTSGGEGDPETIYLSPVEQSINTVRWNACRNFQINQFKHYINIVIPNGGTAISSFQLDGIPVSPALFNVHPQNPKFSYAVLNVAGSSSANVPHIVTSDSGFNAIAYGYGSFESYGYNAGTNVKDLYSEVGFITPWGEARIPGTCKNTPVKFRVSLPYLPDSMYWDFHGFQTPNVSVPFPVPYDSTTIVNGKQVWWFSLPSLYTYSNVGTFPVTVTSYTPNADCGSQVDLDFNVTVYDLPIADFNFTTNGCVTNPVTFTDNTTTNGRPVTTWYWNFGDGGTAVTQNTSHTYAAPGSYNVKHSVISDIGCKADTVIKVVTLVAPPTPTLSGPTSACLNSSGNVYTTQAGMTNYIWTVIGGTITAGGNSTSNTATVTWTSTGSQSISVTYSDPSGCAAIAPAIFSVTVNPLPTPTLTGPTSACLNSTGNVYTTQAGKTNYVWAVVGGTITAGGTSTSNTATITWTSVGTQSISVNYTDANGCTGATATVFNVTVNPSPIPTLSGPTSVCLNSSGNVYTTQTGKTNYVWTIVGGTITAGGNSTSNTATVTWTTTGAQSISVNYTDANGCAGATATTYNVTVNALPTPTLSGPTSGCLNAPGNVYTTQGGMTNYSWTVVGGTITAGGNSTSNTATVTWTSIGTQSISVNYIDANGCTAASATIYNVTVGALPTPTLSGPTSACLNSAGNVYTTQAGMINYNWTIVGGTITAGGTPTSNTATVTWTSTGSQSISVIYSDPSGCAASTPGVFNVTVNPLPTPTINGPTSVCVNSTGNIYTTEAGKTNYSWTIVGGTITAGGTSTSNTATVTWTNSGTQSISVNYTDANGCTGAAATVFNVTVNALPIPTLSGSTSVCLNSTGNIYTTQSGNTNYVWAVVGGTITAGGNSTSNTATITWTSTGAQSISVSYTDANGCTAATATVYNVTVNPLPTPTLSGPTTACLNFPGNVYSTQAGNSNYIWTVVGGTITAGGNSTSNTATITWTSTGTQSISVNYTDANGCSNASATVFNVTVNTLPTPTLSGPTSVCLNSVGNVYTTEAGNTNYTWTVVGGTITAGGNSTSNTATVTWTSAGAQSISVNYSFTNGCTGGTATVYNVNVNALPTPTISGSTSACLNSAANVYTTQAGNTNYVWAVVGGTITAGGTSTSNTATVTWTSAGTQSISVSYTDANGCTAAAATVYNVTVKPLPTATITGTTEVCLNNTSPNITFTGANGTAPYTFVYTINGGPNQNVTTSSGNSVTVPVSTGTAGTFTYSLVSVTEGSTNACSQNQTGSVAVTVNPLPSASFNTSVPSCETNDITFTDASLANAGSLIRWTWDYGDGSNAVLTNGNPFTHVYATAGTYTAMLTVETNKGCISTIFTKPIIVNVRPTADFTAPQICINDPVAPFTDGSQISAGNITSWNWSFDDGGSSTQQNPSHPFTTPGNHSVILIVTSNQGCTDTISKTFVVNGTPTANYTVQNQNTLCSNQDVNITDGSSITAGNIIRTEIYWDYNNDPTIQTIDNSPVIGRSYSHTYPEFGTPATKTVSIRYVTYSGITCLSSFTRTVTLLATPTLQFDPVPAVCSNEPSFQITQAQVINGLSGSGTFSGTGVSPTGFFDVAAAGAGSHTIRYTYDATNGCSNYIEQIVRVNPTPSINAGPDKFVLEGGVVQLTPSLQVGGPPITYLWTPATGLADPTNPFTNASPAADITYTLTVVSDQGCTASDQVFVKVLKAPVIPNIFSPNNDGVHDKWEINYLSTYPGCTVDIYNRYGQLVFHSVGYPTPWDGTVHGVPVPVGTYYYIVNPKNGRKLMTGYVDVIR